MILEIQELTKQFRGRGIFSPGKEFKAVDKATFSIAKNTIFGLVGESGSGKTTLARCLLHLDEPTSGKVTFDGIQLNELSKRGFRKLRYKIQIIFQDPNAALNPKLTIKKSMEEGLKNKGVDRETMDKRITELLELVGITPSHMQRYPHEFSGGQKQRIVVARALSMDPSFMILDEPVSNLDVSIQAQIINLLLELKERFNLTYLFISHDLNLVSYLSDTIGVMFAGRIIELGPAERIIKQPLHPYTRHLFSSVPGAGVLIQQDEDGETAETGESEIRTEAGCPYLPKCPRNRKACEDAVPDLTEYEPDHFVACFSPFKKQAE